MLKMVWLHEKWVQKYYKVVKIEFPIVKKFHLTLRLRYFFEEGRIFDGNFHLPYNFKT